MNADQAVRAAKYARDHQPVTLAAMLVDLEDLFEEARVALARNPLAKLAELAAQKTSRTEQLHGAACMLLRELDAVEVETTSTVSGWTIRKIALTADANRKTTWLIFDDQVMGERRDLLLPPDELARGVPFRGADRRALVAFGVRASLFVTELLEKCEQAHAELDEAAGGLVEAGLAIDQSRGAPR